MGDVCVEYPGVKKAKTLAGLAWSLSLVGCGSAGTPSGASATDAAGTDAQTESRGEGTSGAVEPSAVCEAYLRCVTDVTPEALGSLLEAYGPSGTCWQDAEVAGLCSDACESATESLEEAFGEGACEETSDGSTSGPGGSGSTTSVEEPVVLDLGGVSCVEFGAQELQDFIVSGAAGSLSCAVDDGIGSGRLPNGLTVTPDCRFDGEIREDRFGGWAAIVRVSQAGVPDQFVPFCATQLDDASPPHVQITPTAVARSEFAPGEQVQIPADQSPNFQILGLELCRGGCSNYSYTWGVTPSPFDGPAITFDDELLEDRIGVAIGLTHGLTMTGRSVSGELEGRPWVALVLVDYCFASRPISRCESSDAAAAFAVVMHPQ